jgi:hypothetical protein
MSFKDKLKQARLPQNSIAVCIRGDLQADFEAAERDLKRAQQSTSDSLEEGTGPIVDRIESIRQQMLEEGSEDFRLTALPKPAFRALVKAHPPRRMEDGELDRDDVQFGFNRETFFDALLKVSTISPEMGIDTQTYLDELVKNPDSPPELPDGDWPELFAVLTDRQYGDLTDVAWFLNRGEVNVPFSRSALLAKRNSGNE